MGIDKNYKHKASTPSSKISVDGREIRQKNDPWKVLVKKLDSTKSSRETFGKIIKKSNISTVPDELKCR